MSEQTLLKGMFPGIWRAPAGILSGGCVEEKASDHGPVRPIQLWQVRSDAGAARSGHGSAAQPATIMSANVKRFI